MMLDREAEDGGASARASERVPGGVPRTSTLLAPFAWANLFALVLVVVLATPNILLRATAREEDRFVPAIERVEDVIGWAILAAPVLVVWLSWRARHRVWARLNLGERIGYAIGLAVTEVAVVWLAFAAVWLTRADYSSELRGSTPGPHGQTAYLYAGGVLDCTFQIYVPNANGFTMKRVHALRRQHCSDQATIVWPSEDGEGSSYWHLVNPSGHPLRDERPSF